MPPTSSNENDNDNGSSSWQYEGEHVGSVVRRVIPATAANPITATTSTITSSSSRSHHQACHVLEGKLVAIQPTHGRNPTLWKIECENDNTYSEDVTRREVTTALELVSKRWGSLGALLQSEEELLLKYEHIVQERMHQQLQRMVTRSILPKLVLMAALEEGLQQLLWNKQQHTSTASGAGNNATASHLHQPNYYSLPPSQYMISPTVAMEDITAAATTNGNGTARTDGSGMHDSTATAPSSSSSSSSPGYTPSSLSSRIRLGCQLAWKYHAQFLPPEESIRRSSRLPPPVVVLPPQPVQKGGRVAMFLLHLLEQEQQQPDKRVTNKDTKDTKEDSDEQEESEPEESEEEEDSEEDEEEDSEDEASTLEDLEDNPYLQPSMESVLDYLGRRNKNTTGTDIQNAICHALPELQRHHRSSAQLLPTTTTCITRFGLSKEDLISTDDMVLDELNLELGSTTTTKAAAQHRLVWQCTTGDRPKDLPDLEVASFGKCKFALRVYRGIKEERKRNKKKTKEERKADKAIQMHEQAQADVIHKNERAWANWRFKSIHGAYTTWPSWKDTVDERWNKQKDDHTHKLLQERKQGTETPQDTAIQTTTVPPSLPESDLALAQSLQKQEQETFIAAPNGSSGGAITAASTRTRRTTRRGGGGEKDGPVFYGGQSSMTQKQLMDTVVRLLSQNPQSLSNLNDMVSEESANPFQRLRVVLGKLLWKRNQLSRWNVCTTESDAAMWTTLTLQRPLLIMNSPSSGMNSGGPNGGIEDAQTTNNANEVSSKTEEERKKDDDIALQWSSLTPYLQTLHETELYLRKLIISQLTAAPIATIATAADERIESLEALDADEFQENYSKIEWSASGHSLLNKMIYRPSFKIDGETQECRWYKVVDFTPSVPMSPDTAAAPQEPKGTSGIKEPLEVKCRMRFRATPVTGPTKDAQVVSDGNTLMITEAAVHVGLKAAAAMIKVQSSLSVKDSKLSSGGNPFAKEVGAAVTLQPVAQLRDESPEKPTEIQCTIVGHDTIVLPLVKQQGTQDNGDRDENFMKDSKKRCQHRILVLPVADIEARTDEKNLDDSSISSTAFWATVTMAADGILICRPINKPLMAKSYKIGQSDFHADSRAFKECVDMIENLKKQKSAGVFIDPVDPVVLNIPDYFDVVKRPMDITTLSSNLEKGLYSNIPRGSDVGRTPVARMLNGPFKEAMVLIFDNAMLYNPPDDWIYLAAEAAKKAILRKIEIVSRSADEGTLNSKEPKHWRQKKSVYADEDSDVDMYEYESDRDDEEYDAGSKSRTKRKRGGGGGRSKDDHATRGIESSVRLHQTLNDTLGLSGTFAKLPINLDPSSYSLPEEWSCRHKVPSTEEVQEDVESKESKELELLIELQREVEENERAALRRSTRSHGDDHHGDNDNGETHVTIANVEYFLSEEILRQGLPEDLDCTGNTRIDVEAVRESMHESHYAQLYQKLSSNLVAVSGNNYGSYVNGAFPPFLGRIVSSSSGNNHVMWEIRSSYAVAALRWVLRGLINSGHLSELEPLLTNDSPMSTGVIIPNNVYYRDDSLEPFDILDLKEMLRRRRANNAGENFEESEEEFELSEYEKMRAERVVRNAERLKALGLA